MSEQIRTDNSAVIERLEKENNLLRVHCEQMYSALLAFALDSDKIPEIVEDIRLVYDFDGAEIDENSGFDGDDIHYARSVVDQYAQQIRSGE